MAEWNPFRSKEKEVMPNPDAAAADNRAADKTAAEMIAESLKDSLAQFNQKLDTISQRVEAVEGQTRKPAPKAEPQTVESVFDDEDRAFAQRLTPIAVRQLETEARLALSDVKEEYVANGYGEAWKKFQKDISSTLENSPLVGGDGKTCRGNPEYIRNVVDMVFGREARKAGIKFGGKEQGFFVETAGGGIENTGESHEGDGLTADQRKVFNRMGVTLKDGAATVAKLKFV